VISGAAAQPAEEFYRDQTISMVVSAGVGAGVDATARLVARHLGRHVPGNPRILAKNMPGAGHVRAANYNIAEVFEFKPVIRTAPGSM
jgi:tripartite-type tricarboxylate transporter receptor subunit TctC